jgi:hypothetical protein
MSNGINTSQGAQNYLPGSETSCGILVRDADAMRNLKDLTKCSVYLCKPQDLWRPRVSGDNPPHPEDYDQKYLTPLRYDDEEK